MRVVCTECWTSLLEEEVETCFTCYKDVCLYCLREHRLDEEQERLEEEEE